MAYENVRLSDGNLCTDREHLYVASFDISEQAVVEVDKSTGAVHKAWPTDTIFTSVYSLEFDGRYWWTLEKQTGGFVVRKWRQQGNVFAQLVNTFSYLGDGYNTESMSLEYYSSDLTAMAYVGSGNIVVADTSDFRVGDELIIGPSTEVGYEGNFDEVTITGISGTSIYFSPTLTSRYGGGVLVFSPRAFWIFIDGATINPPSILKYSTRTGNFLLSSSSTLYGGIKASTFYQGKILFQKGTEVYWMDPASLELSQVMAIDNLAANRSTILSVYDMYGYGDYIYRLQTATSYKSGGAWYNATWSTYNTVSSKTVPEVFMVALWPSKTMIHAISAPAVTTASADIYCEVYDQFFSAVPAKTVNFTTDAGTLVPDQKVTDSNGRCRIVYLGDAQIKMVTITAETI